MKEKRKGQECGTKGKRREKQNTYWWRNLKGRNRLENPNVRCDDKTTGKMDLINGVGECGLNSPVPEASSGPM
jgi:hypothetical protein